MITKENLTEYAKNGYTFVRGLFSLEEVAQYIDHFTSLRIAGDLPGDDTAYDANSSDPLKQWPRMVHSHRWDKVSLDWMLDSRLNEYVTALLGTEPYAIQTMVYFKPPGSRGQALHQDQLFARAQPGNCIGAWMALDRCDVENGCLHIVPNTGSLPLLCMEKADLTQSFAGAQVPLAEGMQPIPAILDPGDVLFFNGNVIHGSFPNISNRFRRTMIGHYISREATKCNEFYHPVLRMDGSVVDFENADGGGPCGVWRDIDGMQSVQIPAAAGVATV